MSINTVAGQVEKLLQSKIPITRVMGVTVEDYDGERLVLHDPLEANVNHLGTAFSGSLNALALLSGYGLLWLESQDHDCHIVIRNSSVSYDCPVSGDLRATCVRPAADIVEAFKKTFRDRGRVHNRDFATIEKLR